MKHIQRASMGALLIACLTISPVHAQIPVIDPGNLAQNVIQVAQMIEQVKNQVKQLENEAKMLSQSGLQMSPELSQSIGQARALLKKTEGISYEADKVSDELRELYPETW